MKRLIFAALMLCACARPTLRVNAPPAGCSEWPSLPMTVRLDEEAKDFAPAFSWAADEWSQALGREAFLFTEDPEADALIVLGEPETLDDGLQVAAEAVRVGCRAGRAQLVVVMKDPVYIVGNSHYVAEHELGHVLGLGHSESDESIMFWLVRNQWSDQAGPDVPWPPEFPQSIRETDARVANALHPPTAH